MTIKGVVKPDLVLRTLGQKPGFFGWVRKSYYSKFLIFNSLDYYFYY
ncbi:hypothetical protein OSCI_3420017 [Kamptonema sp. PCC 6506]|nr:hypothetical protein OSCI_3420017 [Kamptonema sp. PCC 6506]